MLKFADLLEAHAAEIAVLDSISMGAPVSVQQPLVGAAASAFRCKSSSSAAGKFKCKHS